MKEWAEIGERGSRGTWRKLEGDVEYNIHRNKMVDSSADRRGSEYREGRRKRLLKKY